MISLHILVHEKNIKEIIRNLSFIVSNLGSDCLSRSTRRQLWRKGSLVGQSRLYRAGSQRERERERALQLQPGRTSFVYALSIQSIDCQYIAANIFVHYIYVQKVVVVVPETCPVWLKKSSGGVPNCWRNASFPGL